MPNRSIQQLGRDDILRAAESFRPSRKLQKWIVVVNGTEFPARPLVLHAARVQPNDPTNSHQAIAKLEELGFETRYAGESADRSQSPEDKSHADRPSSPELEWLASHRKNYAGKWVALRGSHLLASGPDAREVYSKVRHLSPPPLLMRVEEEQDLPFAGW